MQQSHTKKFFLANLTFTSICTCWFNIISSSKLLWAIRNLNSKNKHIGLYMSSIHLRMVPMGVIMALYLRGITPVFVLKALFSTTFYNVNGICLGTRIRHNLID